MKIQHQGHRKSPVACSTRPSPSRTSRRYSPAPPLAIAQLLHPSGIRPWIRPTPHAQFRRLRVRRVVPDGTLAALHEDRFTLNLVVTSDGITHRSHQPAVTNKAM